MSPELHAQELGRFSEIMASWRRPGMVSYSCAKSDDEEDWDDEEFEDEDEDEDEDDEDFDDYEDEDFEDSEEDVPVERRKHRDDDEEL